MELILASGSPRRRELLGLLRLPFRVLVSEADETMDPALTPEEATALVCRRKAMAVQPLCDPDALILSADTIVDLNGRVLGKPACREEALEMLRALSGKSHKVHTAVTLARGERVETAVETTVVRFRELSEAELLAYIATGEPMDKAGAYGIQGTASIFVEGICGDYFNVVGLPLCRLSRMLTSFGVRIPGEL